MSDERELTAEEVWIIAARDRLVEKAQEANAIALPPKPEPDADDGKADER